MPYALSSTYMTGWKKAHKGVVHHEFSNKKILAQYKWSNVFAMINNMKRHPRRNTEPFRDKLVVITGATTGIGYYTARKYAAMGAHLIMVNRNPEKSERVRREIAEEFGTPTEYVIADLALLTDIQRVGQYILSLEKPIDVLIHNAGVHLNPAKKLQKAWR
jgi:retinol dehydrogenase 13